jgi:hypothetical protein
MKAYKSIGLEPISVIEPRAPYRVWSNNTFELIQNGILPYNHMCDDFVTVSLTKEQADIFTYDEIVKMLRQSAQSST